MKQLLQYRKQILLLAFVLFALSILVDEWVKYNAQIGSVQKSITTKLAEQHDEFSELVADTVLLRKIIDKKYSKEELLTLKNKSYTFIVEKSKKIVFWSKFDVVPEQHVLAGYSEGRNLDKIANGYYQISKLKPTLPEVDINHFFYDVVVYALQPVKYDYSWQNKYLKNKSSDYLSIPSIYKIVSTKDVDGRAISVGDSKQDNESTIYLDQDEDAVSQPFSKLAIFMQFLSIFFLLLLLYIVSVDIAQHRNGLYGFLFLFITYLLLREMMFSLNIPVNLELLDLFKTQTEVGPFIPFGSLGNMFISILMITAISVFVYRYVDVSLPKTFFDQEGKRLLNISKVGVFITCMISLLGLGWLIYNLIRLLTLEFNITFHIRNFVLFELNAFIGFICLFLIIFCFFLFCQQLSNIVEQLNIELKDKLIYLTVIAVPLLVYMAVQQQPGQLVIIGWSILFVIVSDGLHQDKDEPFNLKNLFIWGFVFCLLFSTIILRFEVANEMANRMKFAEDLELYQDEQAERHLDAFYAEIMNSKTVKKYMTTLYLNKKSLADYIRKEIIRDKFSAYNVSVTIQGKKGFSLYSDKQKKGKVDAISTKIVNSRLITEYTFLAPNPVTGNYDYISKVPIFNEDKGGSQIGFVSIELAPRFNGYIDNVYPELLIPGKFKSQKQYSFAVYNKDQVVSRKGDYKYKNKLSPVFKDLRLEEATGDKRDYISHNGYSHFCHNPAKTKKTIMVSFDRNLFSQFLFLIAYLFGITCICIFIYSFFSRFFPKDKQEFSIKKMMLNSLKNRINLFVILLTLGCFLTIGMVTAYYFYQSTTNHNQNKLIDESNEILSIVNKQINDNIHLSSDSLQFEKMAESIQNIAENQSSTINLYDTLGYLKKSSMDIIFEKELVAAKMEPEAFYEMHFNTQSQYIQEEQIGDLSYQSIYVPINGEELKTVGYLGIPNFVQREEIRQEMSTFVVTLVNMYILFFIISGTLAIIIADNITRPLTLLREKLQNIRLGQKNEVVDQQMFTGSEEIAGLWREYNNTIIKLDESAVNLRHSERESAWQDMARQVAHEINNPLTAMKLRLQHLQNAFARNDKRVKEIADKTSQTLIEQIDTLSKIATDFSAIAKMTEPKPEIVNINQIISNVVNLNQGTRNVKIFKYLPEEECDVFVDRSQILRVFNNLVKNAIQAIPDNREGIIIVSVKKKSTFVVIGVIDNGVGISNDKKEKVFVHNFTTKNSGMGIGLALSKRIIEEAEGRIWFESTENKTTTFFVRLPLHNEGDIPKKIETEIPEEVKSSENGTIMK